MSDPMTVVDRLPARNRSQLEILDLVDVLERVEQAGPPTWAVEGIWPGDAYGATGAED